MSLPLRTSLNAAEKFAAGRGAIPIREVGEFLGRGHSHVYRLIGRGDLRQITPGRITADSLIEFYSRFEPTISGEPVVTFFCRPCGHKAHGQIGCRNIDCDCTRVTPLWRSLS